MKFLEYGGGGEIGGRKDDDTHSPRRRQEERKKENWGTKNLYNWGQYTPPDETFTSEWREENCQSTGDAKGELAEPNKTRK